MPDAVIVDAVRSPIGRAFKGSLTSIVVVCRRASSVMITTMRYSWRYSSGWTRTMIPS